MSTRRSRGDGGLHWDQSRQRWVATATVGYDGRGKRLVRHGYGRTKTEAKAKLRDLLRSREDGVVLTRDSYAVRQAVEDWLEHGLSSREKATRDANRHLCEKHVLPSSPDPLEVCIRALVTVHAQQDAERRAAGEQWHETGLVFTTRLGTAMDAANVRRDFRRALASVPGLNPEEWTPRELRHSFVSLLSDAGVPIEDVSRLVGHSSTSVTELVYRHQIRPVIQSGATIMDRLFGSPADRRAAEAVAANNGVKSQAGPWRTQ